MWFIFLIFMHFPAFLQFHFVQGLLTLERRKEDKAEEKEHGTTQNGQNQELQNESNGNISAGTGTFGQKEEGKCERERNINSVDKAKRKPKPRQTVSSNSGGDNTAGNGNETDNADCADVGAPTRPDSTDNHYQFPSPERQIIMRESFPVTEYSNSLHNFKRIREMLTFLLVFFKEINSSHKLLGPISETLTETKMRLKELERVENIKKRK